MKKLLIVLMMLNAIVIPIAALAQITGGLANLSESLPYRGPIDSIEFRAALYFFVYTLFFYISILLVTRGLYLKKGRAINLVSTEKNIFWKLLIIGAAGLVLVFITFPIYIKTLPIGTRSLDVHDVITQYRGFVGWFSALIIFFSSFLLIIGFVRKILVRADVVKKQKAIYLLKYTAIIISLSIVYILFSFFVGEKVIEYFTPAYGLLPAN